MAEIIILDAVILIAPSEELWPKQLAAKIELLSRREIKIDMKRKIEIIAEPVY